MVLPAPSSSAEQSSASASSVPAPITFIAGESLLTSHGTFSNGQADFAASTLGQNNTVSWQHHAAFTVATPPTNPWDIQLRHDLSVNAGYRVTVCFSASASANRTIKVDIDTSGPDYASLTYGGDDVIVTEHMQQYVQRFDIAQTDSRARLTLNLGTDVGTVTLDNIHVFTGDEGKADFIHHRYHTREGVAKKAGFIVASLKCPDGLACNNTDAQAVRKLIQPAA